MFTAIPLPLKILCAAAFTYAIVNASMSFESMEEGNHGEWVLDRTFLRGYSGFWIIFSLLPTVYFLAVHPRLTDPDEAYNDKSV